MSLPRNFQGKTKHAVNHVKFRDTENSLNIRLAPNPNTGYLLQLLISNTRICEKVQFHAYACIHPSATLRSARFTKYFVKQSISMSA